MSATRSKRMRETRKKALKIRFTSAELKEARRRADGRPLAKIARAHLLGLPVPEIRPGPKPRAPMTDFEAKKITQFIRFGNNLNQIATKVNLGAVDAMPTLVALVRLERAIWEVASKW